MESVVEIFVNDINKVFPGKFTIDESSIVYSIDRCYSATIFSNKPLICCKPVNYGSASCEIVENTIYIKSGVMNDIIPMLALIK